MNGMLIAVAIIFLAGLIIGYARGFIKIVASFAITIASIVLVMFLSPYVSDFILKNTPIEKMVQEKCIEMLAPDGEELKDALKGEYTREEQISLIENAKVPSMIEKLLLDNNNSEMYETLGVKTFGEYLSKYLAKLIADILAFLVTFIVVTIVARIVLGLLGIIGKLPIVGGLNRIAGGALGLASSLIIVWILFVVITLIYQTEFGVTCFDNIAKSEFLTFLYDNNVLMKYIGGL